MEHVHIEARSAKHHHQDNNLMPLLMIKKVETLIFVPTSDGVE